MHDARIAEPQQQRRRFMAMAVLALLPFTLVPSGAARSATDAGGAAAAAPRLRGLTLEQALRSLRQQGLQFVYSSELVRPEMRVRREPALRDPRAILEELVSAHGLRVEEGPRGLLLLVRDAQRAEQGRIVGLLSRLPQGAPAAGLPLRIDVLDRQTLTDERGRFEFRNLPIGEYLIELGDAALQMTSTPTANVRAGETTLLRIEAIDRVGVDLASVVVTASRYALSRSLVPSMMTLAGPEMRRLPEFGDDPLRSLARLPGLMGSDFSAKLNARGGASDEVLVRFDGLRLLNPFHLKDFLSPFSALNPSVVGDVDVYSGGFPASFGDRMSGVIDIAPPPAVQSGVREVSLSVFNAAALIAGRWAAQDQGTWLVAGRRGNLDLITRALDSRLGRPRYRDFYARADRRFGERWNIAVSALLIDDDIVLSDGDAEERAQAEYQDGYGWLRARYQPTEQLRGETVLAFSKLRSTRSGSADQPGVGRGSLSDQRSFNVISLQSDWSARITDSTLWRWGGEWRSASGRYDYSHDAEFDLLFGVPGAPTESQQTQALSLRPNASYLGAYATLRLETRGRLISDLGLRFDGEDASRGGSAQLSPRIALMYPLTERLQLRGSWGRFVQTTGIDELAASDGVTEFASPQRAEHLVASIEYRHRSGLDLRVEAYRKRYRNIRPRYENLLNTFVLLPELKPDRVRIAPIRAIAEGFELSLRRSERHPLDWWLSYGRASVRDVTAPGVAVPRSWDQRHHVSAGLVWESARWQASLAGTLHSGWPTTAIRLREPASADPDATLIVDIDRVNGVRLRNYRSIDARIARKFRFAPDNELTVFLEATNVAGTRNECCVEFQIDDEVAVPALDVQPLNGRPLVPSIGFVWRF